MDNRDEGTIDVRVDVRDRARWEEPVPLRFPPTAVQPRDGTRIEVGTARTEDLQLAVTVVGPFGRTFSFLVPQPELIYDPESQAHGFHVSLAWKDDRVTLFVNRAEVAEARAEDGSEGVSLG